MSLTISLTAGTPELDHNRRKFIAENVDGARSKSNIVLKDMSLLEAYQEAFGAAIEAYNKTARKYLRLTPKKYLDKIIAGADKKNNPKPCLELILQVGDKDTAGFIAAPENAAKAKDILVDFSQQLIRQTQGHMIILGVYVHMDESTPHVHIDFIPLAHNYKKGLQVRNSLDKCLREMGYTSKNKKINATTAWQFDLRDQLVEICKKHGLEASWSKHDVAEEHLTVAQHKKLMRIAERKKQQALDNYQKSGLLDRVFGKADNYIRDGYAALEVIAAEQLESINKTREILKDRLASIQKRIDDLDRRSKDLDRREEKIRISEIQLNQSRQINDSLWNERNQDLERQRKELEQELLERKKQQDLELQRQKQQQEADLQQQRQQMEEQARLNQLALDNQLRAIRQEKEKAENLKAEAEKDKADAEETRREAAEKASRAVADKSLAETLTRQLKADKAAWEADKKTWMDVEEANKAQREAQAALNKAVKDSQTALDKANKTAKNNLDWYRYYKKRYLKSEEDVKSLTEKLTSANKRIDEMQEQWDEQVKDLTSEIDGREFDMENQGNYLLALRNECYELNKILDEKKLTAEEEGRRRAYYALSEDARESANMEKKFKAVDPTEEFLQKNIRDVKRERNRSRERSRGMER